MAQAARVGTVASRRPQQERAEVLEASEGAMSQWITAWAGTSPRVEASCTRISIIYRMAGVVSLPRF